MGAWADLANHPELVIYLDGGTHTEVVRIEDRAAFRIDLPDGRAVVWEVSLASLERAVEVLRGGGAPATK